MAKSTKRTKKTATPTPRKSPGADASTTEEMTYPDESWSEENCFGALTKNTHIPSDEEASSRTVNKVKEKTGKTPLRNDQ